MLILGVVCFFPLKGLTLMLPGFIENKAVLEPLGIIVQSFANVSFLFFLVSLVLIVYYSTEKGQSLLRKLIPYGKMSLTNYITQDVYKRQDRLCIGQNILSSQKGCTSKILFV